MGFLSLPCLIFLDFHTMKITAKINALRAVHKVKILCSEQRTDYRSACFLSQTYGIALIILGLQETLYIHGSTKLQLYLNPCLQHFHSDPCTILVVYSVPATDNSLPPTQKVGMHKKKKKAPQIFFCELHSLSIHIIASFELITLFLSFVHWIHLSGPDSGASLALSLHKLLDCSSSFPLRMPHFPPTSCSVLFWI